MTFKVFFLVLLCVAFASARWSKPHEMIRVMHEQCKTGPLLFLGRTCNSDVIKIISSTNSMNSSEVYDWARQKVYWWNFEYAANVSKNFDISVNNELIYYEVGCADDIINEFETQEAIDASPECTQYVEELKQLEHDRNIALLEQARASQQSTYEFFILLGIVLGSALLISVTFATLCTYHQDIKSCCDRCAARRDERRNHHRNERRKKLAKSSTQTPKKAINLPSLFV